jgi:hypothetical protein
MPKRAAIRHRPFRGRVAKEGGAAALSAEWRSWIAENLLLRVTREEILGELLAHGVPRVIATRELDAIASSPVMAGARRVARIVRRFEQVARLRRALEGKRSSPRAVERRSRLTSEELVERYYVENAPVVLTDFLDPWPALSDWSPEAWRTRFGDVEVAISSDRDGDPYCDARVAAHAATAPFGDLCDRTMASQASQGTNDFCVASNHHLASHPALRPLLEDLRAPHPLLDDRRDSEVLSFLLGPKGTTTRLHHDMRNVLLSQVFGRKRLLLVPPDELVLMRPIVHDTYSVVDAEQPDVEAFPELAGMTLREVVLSPGEALFVPVGWWHHTRALEASIGITFANLRVPNHFGWYCPGRME